MLAYFGMVFMGDKNWNILSDPTHVKEGNNFCDL